MRDNLVKSIVSIVGLVVVFIWVFTNTYTYKKRLLLILQSRAFLGVFQIAIYLPQLILPTILPFTLGKFDILFSVFGVITYIIGAILAIWAKITIGKSWGIPAQHDIKRQQKLVTSGPYRFTRNPIYIGFLLMLIGFELALRSWLVVIVLPICWYMNKLVCVEEHLLEKHFGKIYQEYKQSVPRFI